MADCFKAIDRIEEAEDCYGTVLEAYPNDDEAMMQLAGIYEVTNRKAEALELVNEIIRMRREKDKVEREKKAAPNMAQGAQEEESMAFFPNQPVPERAKRGRLGALTQGEREEMDARKTQQTEIRYRKLEFLRSNMEKGDPEAVREWLDAAGDLVDDFRNTRALYPHERSVRFKGFMTTAQRRAVALGEARRIEKMQNRLKESLSMSLSPSSDLT
jgi:general transcription factor 3C polypeptide 3 (transcription factor C subunit 4)